jgi:D-beta-D-heptose 7-phosphate kinase/D-beta-D-heptose 1-phosphate adenosyltransferase
MNFNNKKLRKIINNFEGKRIGVVGDLMLDHFIWGNVKRISPEAPVPIVDVQKETFVPGAAGNTACNISSLGGDVFLIGAVGDDDCGRQLVGRFKDNGINTKGIVTEEDKITIQKIRVVAEHQHVVRVDKENGNETSESLSKKIYGKLDIIINKLDVVVISDYAKGLLSKELAQKIIALAKKKNKMVIADSKPQHMSFFSGTTLITPNLKEAREMSGEEDFAKAGKKIQKILGCDVLITRGADGMSLFEGKKLKNFPTMAREVFDVSGAGDTVIGTFSLALAGGANFEEATIISNYAAGIAVGKIGTAMVSKEELLAVIR